MSKDEGKEKRDMKRRIAIAGMMVIAALVGVVLAGPAPEALAQKVIASRWPMGCPPGMYRSWRGWPPS